MNARPTYLCGVLYTVLGVVAVLETVSRFVGHPTEGSLVFVGLSGTLLIAAILSIRETSVQRRLRSRVVEELSRGLDASEGTAADHRSSAPSLPGLDSSSAAEMVFLCTSIAKTST